ncbi:hypothetical protein DFP72DRAFT_805956 [Ephemerocybe angulata]|uniref:Integrase core domain-containing protein n=1 Tax=Ephemerocybe angulata TaxID=980116 RepID=A0A8H6M9E1_9AGAR|nr:hypothetical protein DFP72DRAFT_805956 [Tulosesus angulatus]
MTAASTLLKVLDAADRCTKEANFFISSIPNVDRNIAERLVPQLQAIQDILATTTDFSRLWRDVRKDSLEHFRQIFFQLEELDLLNTESRIHLSCLYLVFHPRIQQSLDETRTSWNNHGIRTARNKTPVAIYELSREHAINSGYWHDDAGDCLEEVDEEYGHDPEGGAPPVTEVRDDPVAPRSDDFAGVEEEKDAGIFVTGDEDIEEAREVLKDMNLASDDGAYGIDRYCEAVVYLTEYYAAMSSSDDSSDSESSTSTDDE